MILQVEQVNSVRVVSLDGKLNLDGCPVVESAISEIPAGSRVLFDLSRLDYVASAGLRLFLQAAKFVARTNGKLALCCLTSNVSQIFRLSGFNTFLQIEPDRAAALKKLEA
jgi:anti-anti-sigma factor